MDILPSSNSFDRHSEHLAHSAPISPALNNNSHREGSSGNLKSMDHSSPQASVHNDVEGDVSGPVEQWVTQPAPQGVLYKCRITRDRKGMDRGLFPIYYLHLERDYGKRMFCLAGLLLAIRLSRWNQLVFSSFFCICPQVVSVKKAKPQTTSSAVIRPICRGKRMDSWGNFARMCSERHFLSTTMAKKTMP